MMFCPLFIGGAFANDRDILLGDMYFSRDDVDERGMLLEYVEDLGDWQSHTIEVSEYQGKVEGSVAVLESGTGACPADNCGSALRWCELFLQLTGVSPATDENDKELSVVDPSSDDWWKLLKKNYYAQKNARLGANPLEFDIERHRRDMSEKLRRKLDKQGTERHETAYLDFKRGTKTKLTGGGKAKFERTIQSPRNFCAECGVTAGLSLCAGCREVAYCCRQHQLDNWPSHKVTCKLAKKKGASP